MEGRGTGSPACSTSPLSETCPSYTLRNILGQNHLGAGGLHRAVFPSRMTQQPVVIQNVLRTKEGTGSRGEAKDRAPGQRGKRGVSEGRARENELLWVLTLTHPPLSLLRQLGDDTFPLDWCPISLTAVPRRPSDPGPGSW